MAESVIESVIDRCVQFEQQSNSIAPHKKTLKELNTGFCLHT